MRFLKGLLIAVVVIVVVLVAVGLFLPRTAHVERSAVINAPACTVFALTNSYKRFNEWSPWAKLDPDATYTYEGPAQGVGAKMSWSSTSKNVGSGTQEIVASEPFKLVKTTLDFGPQGTANGFFTLAPEGDGTRLTWGFDTDLGGNLIARYMGLLMDSMVGGDFEKGLASLKSLAEGLPKTDWSSLDMGVAQVEAAPLAYVEGHATQDPDEIGKALGAAYSQVGRFMKRHRLQPTGPPIAITTAWDASGYSFQAGMTIAAAPEKPIRPGSPVLIGETYGGSVLKAVHTGPYTGLHATYEQILAYMAAYGLEENGNSWEEYVSDPGDTPEAELVTNIYFPVK